MASSYRSILFLWACINIAIGSHAQSMSDGRITSLQTSIGFTQRALSCSGEAVTITCTSNGTGISWESDPPLGEHGLSRIHAFVKSDGAGSKCSYLLNYTDGTAFYVSTVLQDVDDNDCTSSLTLVPIPNNNGLYPTFYNKTFRIQCNTTNTTVTNPEKEWTFRVAAVPESVMDAECTYFPSTMFTKVKITRQQNVTVDLSYYEVSMNNEKANVSARSEDAMVVGLFYPVSDKPDMVQITTVDVCNQRSESKVISCSSGSSIATLMPIVKIITLVIMLMMLA